MVVWGDISMTNFWQDIRYAFRVLSKNRGFTAIAVLTLALGIGANSAIFSVVNSVLLNPLPFQNPDQLCALYTKTDSFERGSISYPNFLDWQKMNRSFSTIAAFRAEDYNLTGAGEPERLHAHSISDEFFPTLGLNLVIGRNFSAEEDRAGGTPVAILGDGLWTRKFASSRDVLGKSITLNGKPYTIVGVAQSRISGLSPSDVYVPIGQWTDPTFLDRRIAMGMNAVGRLKPGMSFAQAKSDMNSIAENLALAYPQENKGSGITVVPLKDDVVGNVRGILFVLQGAVGFVLLIACVNVANLLLARSTSRMREFAVRSALGASPARIIRQLFTESVVLGLIGGAIGLLLAKFATRMIIKALADTLPRVEEITLDSHVLFFTAGVSIVTGTHFRTCTRHQTVAPPLERNTERRRARFDRRSPSHTNSIRYC